MKKEIAERRVLCFTKQSELRLALTPHLDPLPSSDEGRGNPAASVRRTPVSVCERDAPFPLPFGRGEDQGENPPNKFAHGILEPKENIQQPTSNLEHPVFSIRRFLGCWEFDVGCWLFAQVRGEEMIFPYSSFCLFHSDFLI